MSCPNSIHLEKEDAEVMIEALLDSMSGIRDNLPYKPRSGETRNEMFDFQDYSATCHTMMLAYSRMFCNVQKLADGFDLHQLVDHAFSFGKTANQEATWIEEPYEKKVKK